MFAIAVKLITDGIAAAVEAYGESEEKALEQLERTIGEVGAKISELRAKMAENKAAAQAALDAKFPAAAAEEPTKP